MVLVVHFHYRSILRGNSRTVHVKRWEVGAYSGVCFEALWQVGVNVLHACIYHLYGPVVLSKEKERYQG